MARQYPGGVGDERFGPIDFDEFHRTTLPRLLTGRPSVFTPTDARAVRPLAFALPDGRAYTLCPDAERFAVESGDAGADTVVELALEDWVAFVWELQTSFALFYGDRMTVTRGTFDQLALWEPSLRVAFDGQAVYDLDDPPDVLDAAGRPLQCARSFSLDDPDTELADFLHRAGYLHLRGVLGPAEIEGLRTDVEAGIAAARPDDRRSWWTTVDGTDVCNRVNYLNDRSARIAGLGADSRFERIGRLGAPELRDACDRLDGNSVVIKVPGAQSGLADLPWHRDCGMGGHSVKCPMLNIGVQLDPATAERGQLLVIPGSHRGTSRLPGPRQAERLPVVALVTEPGDVTVHFGHTLHAAPPPTDAGADGRRALYLTFVPPLTFEMVGPGHGYNDVLFTREAGHVPHVEELR